MNPELPDHVQRTLADLDARLGRIAGEVAEIRAGLSALGTPAVAPSPQGPGETAAAAPPREATPAAGPAPMRASGPWRAQAPVPPPQQGGPWRPGPSPMDARPGQPGPQPAQPGPWSSQPADRPWRPVPVQGRPARPSRINAAMVIAAIGGAIMLAGVAFLLVVAIQTGLFPPIARVIGTAVLAVILVGLGLRLQSRHEATEGRPVNPGALALVGTGLAAAMLDVIASAVLYQWIPGPAAYMFVGGLALVGMILAQRWRSAVLAGLVAAGTMALSPLISSGPELPIFFVIVGIATAVLAAELGLVVRLIWSVPPAFMLTGYLASSDTGPEGDQIALIVAALVFAVVTVAVAWYDSSRREPVAEYAALVVVPGAVPLLTFQVLTYLEPGWPVGVVLAAAYLVLAYVFGRAVGRAALADGDVRRGAGMLLAAVTGCVGSVLLVAAWGSLDGQATTGLALMLTAIAYVLAAGRWPRPWLEWVAGIVAGLALLVYLGVNQPQLALNERLAVREFTYVDVAASFALALLAVAVTWWLGRRLPGASSRAVMVGAVVALAALSVMLVAAGVVLGDLAGDPRNGFLAAHLVVTVLWICCAAWLVLTDSPRVADARRLGFVLGALALAKLLFLDLATLPGLFRVLSFIVVGAVMLAVAVRYRGGDDDAAAASTGAGPSPAAGGGPAGQAAGAWTPGGGPGWAGNPYRSDTDPSGSGSPT
ncbi:DUF2339 domain-containing protein [Dietzia aurantiaca]|uniref:DUF2339 domain-containing protein n=1 Tax=Dietzia aurantiaca TaxID=983873 RepID=A0ABV9PSK2_9ACTN